MDKLFRDKEGYKEGFLWLPGYDIFFFVTGKLEHISSLLKILQ